MRLQPDQPESALSADEFFDLVDKFLTPPMAALGYHRIHGIINDQPGSRSTLTSESTSEETRPGKAAFLWFQFGFEAGSEDVKRLVGPEDPDSEDEWWVNYEPSTGRLERGVPLLPVVPVRHGALPGSSPYAGHILGQHDETAARHPA